MKSADVLTYHYPDNGAQMGRAMSFFARFALVPRIVRGSYSRDLAERTAAQERQQRAIDRGTFAARALYTTMHVQGRRGSIPKDYRPGALHTPQFPRNGVVDELLPKGTALTIDRPKQVAPAVIGGVETPAGAGDTSWHGPNMANLTALDAPPAPPVNREGVLMTPPHPNV